MTHYTFSQLEDLWVQAGGNPLNKAMAAAIAEAESGGNSESTNDNGGGSIDRGLWQINSGHGSLSTYDPIGNARAAVQISSGGSNWRPWCTAYSDGLCGTRGGTYLGANSPFMKFLNGASTGPLGGGGGNAGNGGGNIQQVGMVQGAAWYDWLIPFSYIPGTGTPEQGGGGAVPLGGFSNVIESGIAGAITDVLAPVGRFLLHLLYVVGGLAIMLYGVKVLTGSSGIDVSRKDVGEMPEIENPPTPKVPDPTAEPEPREPVTDLSEGSGRAGGRRRAASPTESSRTSAPGRHRGQQAREGRTSKAAKKAAEVAA